MDYEYYKELMMDSIFFEQESKPIIEHEIVKNYEIQKIQFRIHIKKNLQSILRVFLGKENIKHTIVDFVSCVGDLEIPYPSYEITLYKEVIGDIPKFYNETHETFWKIVMGE